LSAILAASPRALTIMASVTMNGTSRPYAMRTPLTSPGPGAHEQRAQHHDDRAVVLRRERGGPHRGQRDERADREVAAAADDDESHPDGHHADDRRAHQDVPDVVRGEEVRAGRCTDDAQQDEHDDQAEIAQHRRQDGVVPHRRQGIPALTGVLGRRLDMGLLVRGDPGACWWTCSLTRHSPP
jgi:hypothetical protein